MGDFSETGESEIERTVEFMEQIHTKLGSGEYDHARQLAEELQEGADCELCEALGVSLMGASVWVQAMPMDGSEWRSQQVIAEIEAWLEEIGRPILEDQRQ